MLNQSLNCQNCHSSYPCYDHELCWFELIKDYQRYSWLKRCSRAEYNWAKGGPMDLSIDLALEREQYKTCQLCGLPQSQFCQQLKCPQRTWKYILDPTSRGLAPTS